MSKPLISLIACVLTTHLFSQSLSFRHYGIAEGLSDASVGPILEDSKGFLWLGSSTALNRFDGESMVNYFYDPLDKHSLIGGSIADIYEDQAGKIWIGARGGGINVYRWESDNFFRIQHDPADPQSLVNNYVNVILESSDGRLWIGTDKGLNVAESASLPLSLSLFPDSAHFMKGLGVTDLLEYPKDVMWIASAKDGLFRLDMGTGTISHFQNEENKVPKLAGNILKNLYLDKSQGKEKLWLSSSGGLTRIMLSDGLPAAYQIFSRKSTKEKTIPNNQVFGITGDGQGNIWVATFGGIARLTQAGDSVSIEPYVHKDSDPQSLSDNRVYEVLFDSKGILWVGTERGGLNQALLRKKAQTRQFFTHHLRNSPSSRSKPIQSITALYEDQDGYIWIGSEGDGLDQIDRNGKLLRNISVSEEKGKGLCHALPTGLHQDREGVYWVATFGGLNKMELDASDPTALPRISHYIHDPDDSSSLSDNHIFALYEGEDGKIWLGTRGGGLNRFDKKTETFEAFVHEVDNPYSLSNNYVWDITPEGDSGLWLSTDLGLNYLNLNTQKFYHLHHDPQNPSGLSHNYVNTAIKDSQGRIWVGTFGGGLCLFSPSSLQDTLLGSFITLRQKDGLAEDVIYEIQEDKQGYLWISSNRGLTRFNPEALVADGRIEINAFQHFDKSDGLQDDEFNTGAAAQTRDGKLLFGGLNGINLFSPDSLPLNKEIPPVYITQVEILNEKVRPGQQMPYGNIPLENAPHASKDLFLSYQDYMVSFHFAALNFIHSEDNRYAYKMEGFDSDWIYAGNEQKATYTNLNPGVYTFRVKASNNDGIWNEEGASLKVHVGSPPWKSWWAYALYALSGLGMVWGYIQYRVKSREQILEHQAQLERVKMEERVQVQKETAADFHDELGNNMTKISLFAEMIKRLDPPGKEIQTYLNQLISNTQVLSEGMRDFIWMLDPEKNSLYDSLIRLKEFGEQLFEHTGIQFRVSEVLEGYKRYEMSLSFRRHLLLIVKEALNNLLKYAEASRAELLITPSQSGFTLEIKDNGKGFDLEKERNGYGLRNMEKRSQTLGIDLQISSKIGEGSSVKLDIPWGSIRGE